MSETYADVMQACASSLGRGVETLIDAEKRQAFLSAVLSGKRVEPFATWYDEGDTILNRLSPGVETLNPELTEGRDDTVNSRTAVQYPKLSQERICDMATSRYGSLMGLLCGQAAQTVEPIPIRAYAGEPTRPRPGELSLWVDANMRAWAGYGDIKTLVSASEIIELIALADGAGCG